MIAANAASRRCTSWVGRICVLAGLTWSCSTSQEPKPPPGPTPAAPACANNGTSGESTVECNPATPSSPRESVELAVALRATGKSDEARRVLARALHDALQAGHGVKAVPAWLGEVNEVRFVEPDRFVVRHSDGTSTVAGPDLRELTRCSVSTPIVQLSARGRFAQLRGKPTDVLDLQRCELTALPGTLLTFSPDERTAVATVEGAVLGWDPIERTLRWRQEAKPHGEPKAACVSPAGEVMGVVYASGAAELRTVATGAVLRELRDEPNVPSSSPAKARRPREGMLHSCEFSPDAARLLVSTKSSNGGSPAVIVSKVWESSSGRLLDTTQVEPRDYSSDLGHYLTRSDASDSPRAALHHWRSQEVQTLIPAAANAMVQHNRVQWVTRSDTEFCVGDFASATPQQCIPLAKGRVVRLGVDGRSFVVSDANRHTIHRPAQGNSNTVLLPCDPLAVNGQGRWVTCSQRVARETTLGLWDTQSGRSLPSTVTTVSSAIGFRDDALCARGTCWSKAGETHLPVDVSPLSPDAWVRPGYPKVNFQRAVAMGSDGLLHLATGQTIAWSWPGSARSFPGSGHGPVLEGVFDEEAARAWLLSRDGHLFVFSVADGKFIQELDLPCGGGSELPRMTQVAAGRLIVRLSSGVGCASLVDTKSFAVRALPFSVGYNLALAGDGNRLASLEKGEVSVFELAAMSRVGGFTSGDAVQVGLSFDGLQVATTDWDGLLSAYNARTPLHVDFRAVNGARHGSKKTVEFLREDCEYCDSNSNLVQFERRVVAIGKRLFDYQGEQLASVAPRGRQVLVSFADGQVEVLGSDPAPAYSCLVGTEVLPSEFCAEYVERPGRTASLLQGGASNPGAPAALRSVKVPPRPPLPVHCREPVNLCGGAYLYDADQVSCTGPNTLDLEQLACLTELTELRLDPSSVDPAQLQQLREARGRSLRILDKDGKPLSVNP